MRFPPDPEAGVGFNFLSLLLSVLIWQFKLRKLERSHDAPLAYKKEISDEMHEWIILLFTGWGCFGD